MGNGTWRTTGPFLPSVARMTAVCALVALACSTARAAQYRAQGGITENVGGSFNPIKNYDRTGFAETGGQVNYDQFAPGEPSYHAQADSLAGTGVLRAHAFAQLIKQQSTTGFTYRLTSSGHAEAIWDVIISGPAGPSTVTTSFHLHLSGNHITSSTNTAGNSTRGTSSVQISYFVQNQLLGSGFQTMQSSDGGQDPPFEGGSLVGFDGDATIATPTFQAPVNTAFAIKLRLEATAGIEAYFSEGFVVTGNSDFGRTLTFATDRPVFDLPPGYTADSLEAGIVNNMNVVPEPAASAAVAAAGLLLRRLRRNA